MKRLVLIGCAILVGCGKSDDFAKAGGLVADMVQGRHKLLFKPAEKKGLTISVSSTKGGSMQKSMTFDVDIAGGAGRLGGCTVREAGTSSGPDEAQCSLENGHLKIVAGSPKGMHFLFNLAKDDHGKVSGLAFMEGGAFPGGRIDIGTVDFSS